MFNAMLKKHGSLKCDCEYCSTLPVRRSLEVRLRILDRELNITYDTMHWSDVSRRYADIYNIESQIRAIKKYQRELKELKWS